MINERIWPEAAECGPQRNGDIAKAVEELRQAEGEVEQASSALVRGEEDLEKARQDLERAEHDQRNKLLVSASTTSGFWPPQGFQKELIDQAVQVFLDEAKRKLGIRDVTGWVARVGDHKLNVNQSYHANGLAAGSEVIIDWGPEHGGGGANA